MVLDPGALSDQLRAPGDLPAQRPACPLISDPHRGRSQPPAVRRGSSASTLSVLTFASAIARVFRGFDTTTRATPVFAARRTIACVLRRRLDRDLILRAETVRQHTQRLRPQTDPARIATQAVFQIAIWAKRDAHPDRYISVSLLHLHRPRLTTTGARRANDTYGSALEAQPGKSQGRPSTNTRSKLNV